MDSGQDSGQDTGTPLVDAAALMGTTPAALRKRLQRGSVPGYKREGHWYVLVDSALPTGSPRVAHGQDTALARTDDRRAADLAAVLDRVAAVYEAQIAAQAETIAELRRRAESAEAELSHRREEEAEAAALFRRRIEQEHRNRAGMQDAQDGPGAQEVPFEAQAAAHGVWGRLRRWWRG